MRPAVSVAALYAAAVFVVVRVEGGLWIGDAPRRTDTALLYSLPEMLQPLALFVLAAAIGVSVGRSCRLRLPLAIGAIGFAMFGFVAWAFQSPPMLYVTPVQIQPVRRPLDITGASVASVPDSWLLEAPGVDHEWSRVIVAPAMSAWHDVYLLGLAAVFAGLAVRGSRGRWVIAAAPRRRWPVSSVRLLSAPSVDRGRERPVMPPWFAPTVRSIRWAPLLAAAVLGDGDRRPTGSGAGGVRGGRSDRGRRRPCVEACRPGGFGRARSRRVPASVAWRRP